ncbi:MAG: metallophosphoesterase family protein [Bacteroidota bacterium]|nr:metallophosphoesterase family protein [Bacteroidota bacterium]
MKLAFISDIHEDIVSLRLAMNHLGKYKVDKLICLGDICGYNPLYYNYHDERNAHECMQIVRKYCDVVIPGNHDLDASESLPKISPEFEFPPDFYELDYFQKREIANSKLWDYDKSELKPMLTNEDISYLKTLSQFRILKTDIGNVLATHYIYPNLSGMQTSFCKTPTDYIPHFDFMQTNQSNIAVAGHAHASRLLCVTKMKIQKVKFGKACNVDEQTILICPSITRGSKKQGFLIIDTIEKTSRVIRI